MRETKGRTFSLLHDAINHLTSLISNIDSVLLQVVFFSDKILVDFFLDVEFNVFRVLPAPLDMDLRNSRGYARVIRYEPALSEQVANSFVLRISS